MPQWFLINESQTIYPGCPGAIHRATRYFKVLRETAASVGHDLNYYEIGIYFFFLKRILKTRATQRYPGIEKYWEYLF